MLKKLLLGLLCTTFTFSSCIANIGNVFAEEIIYQNGDVNCDGKLNSTDCAIILQKVLDSSYIMPIENVTTDYIAIADMDGDGVLTASDAAIVMQKILNNGSSTPSEDTTKDTTEPTTEVLTEPTTEPTTEALTEPITEPTTEAPTEPTTELTISYDPDKGVYMENEIDYVNMPGVLKNEITFSDTENGELSPYVKDVVTITAVSGRIETADINIYNYNKAVLLNGTLTVNIPENIHHIEIIGRVSPDASEGAVYDNSEYVSIPLSDTDFTMVNKIGKGSYTISGFDIYIAAIKLYGDNNGDLSSETTTEISTETTTNDAIELDFSDIENGTYTTDISKDIFSIMAGDGSYSVEGEDVSKYIKLNPSDIDSDNSEGYILIDGSNMTDGFSLNIEGFIDGQSYCILSLINESGDVEDQIYENWGFERSNITLNANSAGKYILKVSCLPLRIYKLSISSKLQA